MYKYHLDTDTALTGPIYLTHHIITIYPIENCITQHIVYSHKLKQWILINDHPYTHTILNPKSQISLTSALRALILLIYIGCFLKVIGIL
jgi:hypothetical protein